jgi:hypothetical protein
MQLPLPLEDKQEIVRSMRKAPVPEGRRVFWDKCGQH